MTKQLLVTSVVAITGLLGSAIPSAHAVSFQGVDFTSIGAAFDNGASYVFGYSFTVNAKNITVDKLGYFDAEKDGLLTSHNVGIFRESDQSLVVSATIPSGTSLLTGFFQYVSVSPTVLIAGETYRIGGTQLTGFDIYSLNNNDFTVNPAITYNTDVYADGNGSTLIYPSIPNTAGVNNGFFGGNFTFTDSTPVPFEFSPALGLGALGGLIITKKLYGKLSKK
ncbi:hypothetical protein Syn7502_03046 [Synechococcus sp. PCC 7502]|uniref:PFE-CTERM domain-containing protein n=1 Tax=Synechococcus sp. PCC 7502 TaxID=1173263 RepID=UPI0002A00072|nr:hypothetical protein [Synechococcus sp. PCC 7502]AFY74948.1 hypothetical protein Syn7502_03046 [Synechococcus sp. PCC 7502]